MKKMQLNPISYKVNQRKVYKAELVKPSTKSTTEVVRDCLDTLVDNVNRHYLADGKWSIVSMEEVIVEEVELDY